MQGNRDLSGPSTQASIKRRCKTLGLTIGNGAALSDPFDMSHYAGGILVTPASLDLNTVIGFKIANADQTAFYPLYNKDGSLVCISPDLNSSRAYPLPDELFAGQIVQLWACTTGGSNVNQTGARGFMLLLKG